MKSEEMKALGPGALIRHKMHSEAYQVHQVSTRFVHEYGEVTKVIAVRVIEATNPDEWDIVDKFGKVTSS